MTSTTIISSYKLSSLLPSAHNTLQLLALDLSMYPCTNDDLVALFSFVFVLGGFMLPLPWTNQQDREINL